MMMIKMEPVEYKKIKVYDDLVTSSMIEAVLDLVRAKGFRYGWQSKGDIPFGYWNLALSGAGTDLHNRKDISAELPPAIKKVWDKIQPAAFGKDTVLVRAYCNAHTYGTEGYVHKDSNFKEDLTAVIYLNRTWKPDWAGETVLFEKNEIIKAVVPKWKRLLIFPSNIKHAARGVSRFCPEARTVLVFKARKKITK